MSELVHRCCAQWSDNVGYCRLSESVEGWGCRLLVCLPDKKPRTDHAKAKLFHKVYSYAEKVGVLGCPHFRENIIDEVLDTPERIGELVHLSTLSRADLLSENFDNFCNKL